MDSVRSEREVDVLVIGAGAAGLSAAVTVEQRGLDCLVVEAQDRLGGRVHTVTDAKGCPLDLGGQFLNQDMSNVFRLAKTAGSDLIDITEPKGYGVVVDEGHAQRTEESPSQIGAETSEELLSLAENWTQDLNLKEAMSQAFDDPDVLETVLVQCEELVSLPPDAVSALAAAETLRTFESERSDAEFYPATGLGAVVATLAKGLRREPLLSSPVERIEHDGTAYRVSAGDLVVRAKGVVVAVPPAPARRMTFPESIANTVKPLLDGWISGDTIKVTLIYDKPFWRETGMSGQLISVNPMRFTAVDTSRPEGSSWRLTAFLGGETARTASKWTEAQRREAILSALAAGLGESASQPIELVESVWVDHRWVGGGYAAHIRAGGDPDAPRKMAKISGSLVFCGTEYAERFRGLVEGAIVSGQHAAQRLKLPDSSQAHTHV